MEPVTRHRIEDVTPRTLWASFGVLARAFADDPVIRWVQPSPRLDRVTFAGIHVASHGAPGASHLLFDGAEPVAAASWDPPGHAPHPLRQVASLPLLAAGISTGFGRGAALVAALEERRPAEPHWYLATIGSAVPGRGFGSALLRYGLERVTGTAYLESSNPRNVPLYQRFGFEPLAPIRLPRGPELIPMLRPAR
ncbi:GNAT family N-acetyltransferase [Tsukamurella tyrosinosolvens]|uniref:GNAT family N-acetyltransferase n=1 Tax=Tsukamurella tyrosinosolvens TaxID=57704 RepID=UPI00079AA50C|nr:GNAT family N-acetyltransferase [Tsukamurella tyrosinosolvens]KXP01841.1 hypothetical protein AXK59_22615 [Tsukamurella tyrosinosolvens]KZL95032.1 hypothetical protein AXX05_10455 [Tsukamurella tyrosinosolvens]WEL93196.1 GNAT family N-acetyltransferase [Tsukamurella tyrosinosolvens]